MVYALGSHLPDPLRTEARTKTEGMSWMRDIQARVKASQEIVLVGGGALGVEFATDIKSVYPDKKVTLIHSRKQLLPNFDEEVHKVALKRLQELGVDAVLGERLALTEGCPRGSSVKDQPPQPQQQPAVCTPGDAVGEGSQAHKEVFASVMAARWSRRRAARSLSATCSSSARVSNPTPPSWLACRPPVSIRGHGWVRVLRTLQVQVPTGKDGMAPMPFDPTPPCGDCDCFLDKKAEGGDEDGEGDGAVQGCLSNVYAIGDVADAFGAPQRRLSGLEHGRRGRREHCPRHQPTQQRHHQRRGAPRHPAALHTRWQHAQAQPRARQDGLPGPPAGEGGDGRPVVEEKEDPHDLAVQGVWQFMANMSTDDMYSDRIHNR
ncbi:hypothetical protein L7F22_003551 [Adiantum nelumboides]|nr:hypothetical protein [Adiantum nelumboides]